MLANHPAIQKLEVELFLMWNLIDRANKHPHNAGVQGIAVGESGVYLGRGIEITTAVCVISCDSGGVSIRKREGVHLPPTAIKAGISGRGCRNIWLQAAEVIDGVEAVIGCAGIGQIGRRGDRSIENAVDVERGTTDATRTGRQGSADRENRRADAKH